MNAFEQVCRPVIFESDAPECVYWRKGSSFLVSNSHNCYWVTATHVLKNMGANIESVRIHPSDNSRMSLPFNEKYLVKPEAYEEDFHDIAVVRVDLSRFDKSGDAPLISQDIERGFLGAEHLKISDEIRIVGYPSESNHIDYETRLIQNNRVIIRAIYDGESFSDHCHRIRIESSIKLVDMDGLSGSPVFHMQRRIIDNKTVDFPMLVGMLLRGTASSGIAHFVSSSVIVRIIKLAEELTTTEPSRRIL